MLYHLPPFNLATFYFLISNTPIDASRFSTRHGPTTMPPLTELIKRTFSNNKRRIAEEETEQAAQKKAEEEEKERNESRTGHLNDEWDARHREYDDSQLPVLIDQGAPGRVAVLRDELYWNSVLVQERGRSRERRGGGYDVVWRGRSEERWIEENSKDDDGYEGDADSRQSRRIQVKSPVRSRKGKERVREPVQAEKLQQLQHTVISRERTSPVSYPMGRFMPPDVPYMDSPTSLDSEYDSHPHYQEFKRMDLVPEPLHLERRAETPHVARRVYSHRLDDEPVSNLDLYNVSPKANTTHHSTNSKNEHQETDIAFPADRPSSARTASSTTINTKSQPFDSTTALPADQTILVYGPPGHRRRLLPQMIHRSPSPLPSSSSSPPSPLPQRPSHRQQAQSHRPQPQVYYQFQDPFIATGPIFPTRSNRPRSRSHSRSTSPPKYDGPTWNETLNVIVSNDSVDPTMANAVRDRAKKSGRKNGHGIASDGRINAVDVGLVPNFSYPVQGACWHDKWLTEGMLRGGSGDENKNGKRGRDKETAYREMGPASETSPKPSSQTSSRHSKQSYHQETLANGTFSDASPTPSLLGEGLISTSSADYSDSTHTRSSHLANNPKADANPIRTTPSPSTLIHLQKDKLAKQFRSIRTLNRKIARLAQKKDFYKYQLSSYIENWGACEETVQQFKQENYILKREKELMMQENEALWTAVRFSKNLATVSFERDKSIVDMVWDFKERQVERDNMKKRFGGSLLGKFGGQRRPQSLRWRGGSTQGDERKEDTRPKLRSRKSSLTSARSYISNLSRKSSKRYSKPQINQYDPRTEAFYGSSTPTNGTRTSLHTIGNGSHKRESMNSTQAAHDEETCIEEIPDKFPTVMEEIDALVLFTDLHMQRLVEDVQDLVAREEDCWAFRIERERLGREVEGQEM
ncbi:hypothetical protein P280DRAFT_232647 [Massarina eburnea CBS 473.64]|uniref:Uncharacterized protein n=1 Tax=Massarina eburnea CBS 473.64 TaxID=1395130 RepID=A0A6A6RI45_9PLEO|nr:hypothetical protein P280DRAFT_232647 [Massarina eburnea CBS 473.64]